MVRFEPSPLNPEVAVHVPVTVTPELDVTNLVFPLWNKLTVPFPALQLNRPVPAIELTL